MKEGTLSFECTHCNRAFYFDSALLGRAWNYLKCFSCEGLMFVSRDLRNRIALKNKPPIGLTVFDTLPEEMRVQKSLEKVLGAPRPVPSVVQENKTNFTNAQSHQKITRPHREDPVENRATPVAVVTLEAPAVELSPAVSDKLDYVPQSTQKESVLKGVTLRFFLGLILGASVGTILYFLFQGKAAWDALQSLPK